VRLLVGYHSAAVPNRQWCFNREPIQPTQETQLSQISEAIAAKQTRIAQLQSEIETLQRAASIMGDGATALAKATPKKPKAKSKATPQPKPQPKKKPRAPWSAARRQRMKKYWAKRRKAKG